uniref:CA domain-containing protein n=1 Tax=Mesocestoides corti TaxID=53468 RepID=A0A158QS49_MESCO
LDVLQPPHPSSGNSDGVGASSLFAITSNGEIYTRNFPIDREKTPILSFTVVAFDNGQPPLSAFANVVIRVQDVNDHAPVWVFPQSSNNPIVRVNISSYATVGREVAQLKAMDADSGPNGEVEYEIIKGNEQEYFALDKTSGMLYLAKPFGIETKLASKENNEAAQMFNQNTLLYKKSAGKPVFPFTETPVHRKIPMMHLDGDVYDRFSPAVLLSSSSHPSSRKGPSVGTSSDVVPIGYMVTSNPALFEPKLATYESIHLPSQVPNDAPVSSTENEKKAYNSLNCRLPKEIKATIEKKYMSLKPEFFTQDVYRKLNVGEVRDEIVLINRVQCDRELANGLTGLSQKRASVIQGRTEKGQISSRVCEATPKKHCRFELKSKAEETELLSKSKVLCGIQKQDGKF